MEQNRSPSSGEMTCLNPMESATSIAAAKCSGPGRMTRNLSLSTRSLDLAADSYRAISASVFGFRVGLVEIHGKRTLAAAHSSSSSPSATSSSSNISWFRALARSRFSWAIPLIGSCAGLSETQYPLAPASRYGKSKVRMPPFRSSTAVLPLLKHWNTKM